MEPNQDNLLDALEADIKTKIFNFEKAGLALKTVKEKNLYRKRRYLSFYRYAKKCFDMDRAYLDDFIKAAEIVQNLRQYVHEDLLPKNMTHAVVLGWLKDPEDQAAALRLAYEKTAQLDDPVLSLQLLQESIEEVKSLNKSIVSASRGGELPESQPTIDPVGSKADETQHSEELSRYQPKEDQTSLQKLSPRRGDSEISMDMIDQMVEETETMVHVSKQAQSHMLSDSSGWESEDQELNQAFDEIKDQTLAEQSEGRKNKKKFKPRFGETIFGRGMSSVKPSSESEMDAHHEVEQENSPKYANIGSVFSDASPSSRGPASTERGGVEKAGIAHFNKGLLTFNLAPYGDIINYREGLMARVASQSIAYMAAMEIGRQADCACDQTLLAFGDEIAREIENSWEEAALGLSNGQTPNSHDLRIVLEDYGQARIRLTQKGVQFELHVQDIRIWDTYRHQVSGWPLTLEEFAKQGGSSEDSSSRHGLANRHEPELAHV